MSAQPPLIPTPILVQHLAATRQDFMLEHGKAPGVLALGRWDARELARFAAPYFAVPGVKPSQFLHAARQGAYAWGAEVKVDCRLGRMPGAFWWQP